MIRVVLDTNIYVSAFLFGGKPSQILKQIEDGRFALYYSQPIRVEMEEVLAQKFGWPDEMIHLACAPLWSIGYLTMPRRTVQACSDPDDDRILECALEAQAQFIVTGDKHLLQMVSFEKIRILKPSEFLKSVGI